LEPEDESPEKELEIGPEIGAESEAEKGLSPDRVFLCSQESSRSSMLVSLEGPSFKQYPLALQWLCNWIIVGNVQALVDLPSWLCHV
jgi:hypothetical protein